MPINETNLALWPGQVSLRPQDFLEMMEAMYGSPTNVGRVALAKGAISPVGAPSGSKVTLAELTGGQARTLVFTLTSQPIATTDNGVNGAQGSLKIYDFPKGAIQILGASYNLTTIAASGITATAALIGSLGSAAAGAGDSTLTGTEADIIASTTGTLTGSAGTLKKFGSLVASAFDGTSTALTLNLNLAVPDAGSTANSTVTVSGEIRVSYVNLGTF